MSNLLTLEEAESFFLLLALLKKNKLQLVDLEYLKIYVDNAINQKLDEENRND